MPKRYFPPPGSIGYINIIKHSHVNQRQIQINSTFFAPDEDITVELRHDKIIFRKPGIFHIGKTYKLKYRNCGGIVAIAIVADIPYGYFEFDPDESNIDEMVVYLQ